MLFCVVQANYRDTQQDVVKIYTLEGIKNGL